jgi:hypothetical protein
MPGAKPYSLSNTITHPLARMLPLGREQVQVYRLGERLPPSGEFQGYGPMWEAINMVLQPRSTLQARVNFQRAFTLLSVGSSTSSNVNGGFRAQFYDMKKQRRFADRGVQQAVIGGSLQPLPAFDDPIFLREPYQFDLPDSQALVLVQNLEIVVNTIQFVLYGVVLRFNEVSSTQPEFPGGLVSSMDIEPVSYPAQVSRQGR